MYTILDFVPPSVFLPLYAQLLMELRPNKSYYLDFVIQLFLSQ